MFSLLAGFLKWLFAKTEIQILILGLDHAGKTTLLEQMKRYFQKLEGIPLDKIPPTVGLNIGKMDINSCRVIFWDLGGQQKLRTIWTNYYSEAHGVIFVLDSADPTRFEEARQTLNSLLRNPDLSDLPVLICANKQDLMDSKSVAFISEALKINKVRQVASSSSRIENNSSSDRIIDNLNNLNNGSAFSVDANSDGELLSVSQKLKVQAISALNLTGVDEGIRWLVGNAVSLKSSRTLPKPPGLLTN